MNGLRVWLIVVRIESVRNCNASILALGNSTAEVSKGVIGHKDVVGRCSLGAFRWHSHWYVKVVEELSTW